MDFLANDLSIHNQFMDLASFEEAIDSLMLVKKEIDKSGRVLHCNQTLINQEIIKGEVILQVVQSLPRDKRHALLIWLTKGPFWDSDKQHSSDDYFDIKDQVVTDSAIAEAAFQNINGNDFRLVSFKPSTWQNTEIEVTLIEESSARVCKVFNYTECNSIKVILSQYQKIESWEKLSELCRSKFNSLFFSETCFDSLKGHPFVQSASNQILELCQILDKLINCFDSEGNRTEEGQQIYQSHFTGDKSWFSDSSKSEKDDFKSELTFKHPETVGDNIFCPMHGKINTPKFRVHFSWPIDNHKPLYIVYVGPKITKR